MDVVALGCCVVMTWYGVRTILDSYAAGAVLIRSFIMPERWLEDFDGMTLRPEVREKILLGNAKRLLGLA